MDPDRRVDSVAPRKRPSTTSRRSKNPLQLKNISQQQLPRQVQVSTTTATTTASTSQRRKVVKFSAENIEPGNKIRKVTKTNLYPGSKKEDNAEISTETNASVPKSSEGTQAKKKVHWAPLPPSYAARRKAALRRQMHTATIAGRQKPHHNGNCRFVWSGRYAPSR